MKKEGRKKKAFIHILSSLSPFLSLYLDCVLSYPSSPLLLRSYKCHSSLSLTATIDDLFQRDGVRERGMRGREGGMKERNGCLLTWTSERQENKAAMTKARVLFSPLFSLLGIFVKGAVVSSVYLYILFRRGERGLMKCVGVG